MRVKLELDASLGLSNELSKVWFTIDPETLVLVSDLELNIRDSFAMPVKTIKILLDGYRLLSYQLVREMIQEGCILHIKPSLISEHVTPVKHNSDRKRKRLFEPISPPQELSKQPKRSSLDATPSRLQVEKPEKVSTHPVAAHKKKQSSPPFVENIEPPEVMAPTPWSETTTTSSSSTSSSSSDDSETSSSSSSSSSTSSSTSSSSSSSSVEVTIPASSETKKKRRRLNKRQREALKPTRADTLHNKSFVYLNGSTEEPKVDTSFYDALPPIALNEVRVGQIVAWRTLELSPTWTAELAPWQERQLVSISPTGLIFVLHNPHNYLNAWWYDDDGEKVSTVKDWLKERNEELSLEVTLPLDHPLEDIRLLHDADAV